MQLYDVIKLPVVTEKAQKDANTGKYHFFVNPRARKEDIKKAIKLIYGIDAKKVNILKIRKKEKLVAKGRKMEKRKEQVKAIITLKKGESMDVNKIK